MKLKHTPGMWNHTCDRIAFILAVDDFGIKYFDKKPMLVIFSHSQREILNRN